jgi:hypothetical protein
VGRRRPNAGVAPRMVRYARFLPKPAVSEPPVLAREQSIISTALGKAAATGEVARAIAWDDKQRYVSVPRRACWPPEASVVRRCMRGLANRDR